MRARVERGERGREVADPTVDTKSRADQNPLAQSRSPMDMIVNGSGEDELRLRVVVVA